MPDVSHETAAWTPDPELDADVGIVALRPGLLLADRFRLGEVIGSGASGEVWAALDTRVGRKIALKVLHPHLSDETSRERVRREARAATSGHPNVAAIHDLHETDGRLFLSMELVEGLSLKALLREREQLSIDEVVVIGRDVASALDHLHGLGFVHRDVKPGNIMITPGGGAKLCDLGLSRPVTQGGTLTATSVVVGTPAYMAPEQGRATELSPAADIYSLGLTLYRALTGVVPLEGESAVDTLITRQKTRVESVRTKRPHCPRWLARLLDDMLDPEPARRPLAGRVVRALQYKRWRLLSRRIWKRLTILTAGIAATVLGAVWIVVSKEEPPLPQPVDYRVFTAENGSVFEILDGDNAALGVLRATTDWYDPVFQRTRGVDLVAFGDLDGDGLQEVIFAEPAAPLESGVSVWRARARGGLEQIAAIDVSAQLEYEGTLFDDFRVAHVDCADLTGDGRDEIVLVQQSHPLYPTLLRVIDGSGATVMRLWHPGYLVSTFIADGDEDGRLEVFAAGTCNFIADDPGNESTPVVMRLNADWAAPPTEINLFGPQRSLPSTVPVGIELVYANLGKVRFENYNRPWEMATFGKLSDVRSPIRIYISSSSVKLPDPAIFKGRQDDLRSFAFDGQLNLTSALWKTHVLQAIGLSPSDPALDRFLEISYWNGRLWVPGTCTVPDRSH